MANILYLIYPIAILYVVNKCSFLKIYTLMVIFPRKKRPIKEQEVAFKLQYQQIIWNIY